MPAAAALPQGTNNAESTACTFISGLFKPNHVSVPVYGTGEALDKLKTAVEIGGLFIDQQFLSTPAAILERSCRYLQQAGVFPTTRGLHTLLTSTIQALFELNIDPGQLVADARSTIEESNGLKFKELDLGLLLGMVRGAEIYHKQETEELQGTSQIQAYELGVLSLTERDNIPSLDVQLFRGKERSSASQTIWIYRRCIVMGHDHEERWYSITVVHDAVVPSSTPSVALPTPKPQQESRATITHGNNEPSAPTSARRKRHWPKRKLEAVLDLAKATPEDILSGDPDNVVQDAMLRVAKHYRNTEILNRLNETLRAEGRPELKDVNNVTQRIKLACTIVARREGRMRDEVRNELKIARKANGVADRSLDKNPSSKEGHGGNKQLQRKRSVTELKESESEVATSSQRQTRSATKSSGDKRAYFDAMLDDSSDSQDAFSGDDDSAVSEYLDE